MPTHSLSTYYKPSHSPSDLEGFSKQGDSPIQSHDGHQQLRDLEAQVQEIEAASKWPQSSIDHPNLRESVYLDLASIYIVG